MAYFKHDGILADSWTYLAAGQTAPAKGQVILTQAQWSEQREALLAAKMPLGLKLEPGIDLDPLGPDLHRFALIALNFPKFSDGRSFSTAHLLRIVQGFAGEIRAIGDVLYDQMQLMQRCGIDAFEIVHAPTLRALENGQRPGVSRFYQPGIGAEIPAGTRPWARRRAGDGEEAACFSI